MNISNHQLSLVLSLVIPCFLSIFLQAQTPENLLELQTYESYLNIQEQSPINKSELTESEVSILYKSVVNNPVSKLSSVSKYDPTGLIGFCFGRAMTAQLVARKMGLKETSIRKLFIIGNLCAHCANPNDPSEWRFHVTTLVRGPHNMWYALDPLYPHESFKPVLAAHWISFIRKGWDTYHLKSKAILYSMESSAILPDIRVLPNPETGNFIFELNFIPEKHAISQLSDKILKNEFGISNTNETIYSLSENQTEEYMLTTHNHNSEDRFHFLDITVNELYLPYNGYFVDLFRYLKSRSLNRIIYDSSNVIEPTFIDFKSFGFLFTHY